MNKVTPPSDVGPPRRLKFSEPDPVRIVPQAEQQAKSRERRKKKPERFKERPVQRQRLPDGARFDVRYDAADASWSGSLTVGEIIVKGKAGGVMTLLSVLDEKFRADPRAPKAEPVI